jgi:hypothetical protein
MLVVANNLSLERKNKGYIAVKCPFKDVYNF